MAFRRIVNASPLILLSKVGHLDFLRIDADDVVVPEQVLAEVGAHGRDGPTVREVEGSRWLRVVHVSPIPEAVTAWKLGAGESAVLTLALADSACDVVLDDMAARRRAVSANITVRGTVGMVLLARREGRIPAARPILDHLRRSGLFLSENLAERMLALVGE